MLLSMTTISSTSVDLLLHRNNALFRVRTISFSLFQALTRKLAFRDGFLSRFGFWLVTWFTRSSYWTAATTSATSDGEMLYLVPVGNSVHCFHVFRAKVENLDQRLKTSNLMHSPPSRCGLPMVVFTYNQPQESQLCLKVVALDGQMGKWQVPTSHRTKSRQLATQHKPSIVNITFFFTWKINKNLNHWYFLLLNVFHRVKYVFA